MDLPRLSDRSRYGDVLRVFDAFLAGWEPAVAAALPGWGDWLQARSRRAFLRHDLGALGLAALPRTLVPPRLSSAAAAWGSVYVMEGSALGGQVITRSLAAAGLHPGAGAAYFHGWGEATGAMWREFRAVLDAQLDHSQAVADACDGACRTFDALSCQLEAVLHERAPAA